MYIYILIILPLLLIPSWAEQPSIPSWAGFGPGPTPAPCAGVAGPSVRGLGGPSVRGAPQRGPSTWGVIGIEDISRCVRFAAPPICPLCAPTLQGPLCRATFSSMCTRD